MSERTAASDRHETFDELVASLHTLRIEAGSVTYDELAARITQHRQKTGMDPAAARVARSTVYDAFRTGRSRINADLVADIVTALGEDSAAANEWRLRCLRARLAQSHGRATVPVPNVVPHASSVPDPSIPSRTSVVPHASVIPLESHDLRHSAGPVIVALVMVASLGVNLFGNAASARLDAPLFLDMIGTAIVSIAFGPWYGASVALSTNLLAGLSNGSQALPFVAVNVVGALVWGYGVRSWRMGRTPLRFFSLNLLAALACTLTALPILALNGMIVDSAAGGLFAAVQGPGISLWGAVFVSNLAVSVGDKLIAGYLALALAVMLARHAAVYLAVQRPPMLWESARAREAPQPAVTTSSESTGQRVT